MSLTNNELKKIKALHTQKGRRDNCLFLGEGIRLLEESLKHHRLPVSVFYHPESLTVRGKTLLGRFKKKNIDCIEVTSRQLAQISDTKQAQAMIAVFETGSSDLPESRDDLQRRVLVSENLADPGNAGTLMRSALAFGFSLFILTGNSVDPFSPKVVRSSSGAIFGLKIAVTDNARMKSFLEMNKIKLLASSAVGQSSNLLKKIVGRNQSIALAIGSEAEGLSDSIIKMADSTVRIDHAESVESLNAAVAGSILMMKIYEITKS